MIKKNERIRLIVALVIAAACILSACGAAGSSKDNKIEISEQQFVVDPDTGYYTAVILVTNNTENSVGEVAFLGTAYDADGKKIKPVANDDSSNGLFLVVSDVDPGETGAAYDSGWIASGEDSETRNPITAWYEEIPASIEWKAAASMPYGFDSPLGLRFSDCSRTGAYSEGGDTFTEYSVNIENTGAMDISYNEEEYIYEIDGKPCSVGLLAVIRDSDGNIIGAGEAENYDEPFSCSSGEKTSTVVTVRGDFPQDASAEIYIQSVMELEEY